MEKNQRKLIRRSSSSEVNAFLEKVAATPAVTTGAGRGRLIFAMDATASREPTWDHACQIQAEMFRETAALGGLEIQLCYYRGILEFETLPWLTDQTRLSREMSRVQCAAGHTQIGQVLRHALSEAGREKVNALVFVGDCMEEDPEVLAELAGKLGLLGMPVFLFQEGYDPLAEQTFRRIAGLAGGAYCRFDAGSARQLRELLSAVAVYAAGGRKALENFSRGRSGPVPQLIHQLKKG